MRFSSPRNLVVFAVVLGCAMSECRISMAQTVHVDVSDGSATAFDPDKAMGTTMDILPAKDMDKVYSAEVVKAGLSAGWGPISYRQNTELTYDAWHWNPNGKWSDEEHKSGYFVGDAEPHEFLSRSYGYRIAHRGTTRSDSGQDEYSRMTDGDLSTYWKSNPYLTSKFTGQPDSMHPQWVVIEFGAPQQIDAIRIAWANPYATRYEVEYWSGNSDALDKQAEGLWVEFPLGIVAAGTGGNKVQRLADHPVSTRFLRIWMTESSNTCDTHGAGDQRNCVGYAIAEISAGNFNSHGEFIDIVQHEPGQAQTVTQASSVDPWHTGDGMISSRVQTGFDLFFTSGYTNHLPAMVPIAMIYATPEDSAAEIAYIEKRGYPLGYVEMGEEPDGAYMLPEDYAELYIQWAAALHKVDKKLKLGGPVFTGENTDIKTWADAEGRTSWLGRFIDYLEDRGKMSELAFVSYEHYPLDPCNVNWSDLYRETQFVDDVLDAYREDGVPDEVPLMITESNVSWSLTDPMQDLFSALWLGNSVGAFLTHAGPNAVYYHSPVQPEPLRPGCHSWSTYGNFVADEHLEIKQYTAQYFASQMLNLDWVQHGAGTHEIYPTAVDFEDDARRQLISAFAIKRPDGQFSLLIINKDPSNPHSVRISFDGEKGATSGFEGAVKMVTFGPKEYAWHSSGATSHADPDGPPSRSAIDWKQGQPVELPSASMTVLTGKVGGT